MGKNTGKLRKKRLDVVQKHGHKVGSTSRIQKFTKYMMVRLKSAGIVLVGINHQNVS